MTSFVRSAVLAIAALCTGAACAQTHPTRPIRLIVPFAPGGPTDTIARIVSAHLGDALAQQVIIDNRAGAGGNIGMGLAANATPDGHTAVLVSSSFVVNPGLYSKIPYDPEKPMTTAAAASMGRCRWHSGSAQFSPSFAFFGGGLYSAFFGSCLGLGVGIWAPTSRRQACRRARSSLTSFGLALARSCCSPMSLRMSYSSTRMSLKNSMSLKSPERIAP